MTFNVLVERFGSWILRMCSITFIAIFAKCWPEKESMNDSETFLEICKYRGSPVSAVSISAVPGLVRFTNRTKYDYSPI